MSSAPSPNGLGFHASEMKIGTKKKGYNGNMWIVAEKSNGSHFWKPYKKTSTKKSSSKKINKPVKKSSSRKRKSKMKEKECSSTPQISCGEVTTGLFYGMFSITIKITEEFLKVLKKKPSFHSSKLHNAYVFGKLYPLGSYKFIGEFGNDVGQCGIVDTTCMIKEEVHNIENYDDEKIFRIMKANGAKYKNVYNIEWDDPLFLKIMQKEVSPKILFIGQTFGGDVGGNIYVHYNDKKQVDSLIIDSHHFFGKSS